MSFLRRLFGSADDDHRPRRAEGDDATADPASSIGDDEPLSDDLREYLRPKDPFVARQQALAAYKWTPPPNEPQRDPRLAPLGALLDAIGVLSATDVRSAVDAYRRRPRDFDRALAAAQAAGAAAGRTVEVRAAMGATPRLPNDPDEHAGDDEPRWDAAVLAVIRAAATAVLFRDLIAPGDAETLLAPVRAAFPDRVIGLG